MATSLPFLLTPPRATYTVNRLRHLRRVPLPLPLVLLTRTACLSALSITSRGPYVLRPPKDPPVLIASLLSSARFAHTAACSLSMLSFRAGYLRGKLVIR